MEVSTEPEKSTPSETKKEDTKATEDELERLR